MKLQSQIALFPIAGWLLCWVVVQLTFVPGALAQPSPADLELAKRHFELGRTYYDQAAYDRALDSFGESYRLSNKPALLFNIGKCHEALGQIDHAIDHYERYIAATARSDPNLTARIENLRRRLEATRPPAADAAQPVPGAPEPTTTPPPRSAEVDGAAGQIAAAGAPGRDDAPSGWGRWTGWGLVGTGVAALGASVVLGVFAGRKADAVERYWNDANRDWAEVKQFEDQGTSLEVGQVVTLVVAMATAGGGATVLLLARRQQRRSTGARVDLVPSLGPGRLGLAGEVSF